MPIGDGDEQALLNEMGVDVSIGAVTAKGICDIADEAELQGDAALFIGRTVSVRVKTGTFPALVVNGTATVDGTDYQIIEVRKIGDGKFTRFWCTPI